MPPKESTHIILLVGDLATAASGPNAVVRRLSVWLIDHGYNVTVVGTWREDRPSTEALRKHYGDARVILHRRYLKDTWHFAPGVIRFAAQLLFAKKPYVIDIHGVWLFSGMILSLVARLKHWRYFVNLHGNLRPTALAKSEYSKKIALRLFFRWCLRTATAVVALNDREKNDTLNVISDLPIRVIGLGVVPRHDKSSGPRKKEVLFLGRIDPIKNLEALVDAFSQICNDFPLWKLSIVGPSSNSQYLEQLKTRYATLIQKHQIAFFDAVYGKEKESFLLSASIFALTSWGEGQPLAVLEAMGHGLPVLVSNQCSIDVPQSCGRVSTCSPESIAEALKEMLALPESQLGQMGTEAQHFVSQEFSEDKAFGERVSLYFAHQHG